MTPILCFVVMKCIRGPYRICLSVCLFWGFGSTGFMSAKIKWSWVGVCCLWHCWVCDINLSRSYLRESYANNNTHKLHIFSFKRYMQPLLGRMLVGLKVVLSVWNQVHRLCNLLYIFPNIFCRLSVSTLILDLMGYTCSNGHMSCLRYAHLYWLSTTCMLFQF